MLGRTQSPTRRARNRPISSLLWSKPYNSLVLAAIILTSLYLVLRRQTGGPAQGYDTSSPVSLAGEKASQAEIANLCSKHGFTPFHEQGPRKRKVYDLFLLSTELDWLEIRLHTLSQTVDYFVIVESPTTFTGLEKPLYLQDNWARFSAFHSQIIHRVVQDPGDSVGSRTWDHEDFMRNALFDHVFPGLVGTEQEAQPQDVLIVSDIDEVLRPSTVDALRYCSFPDRLTLRSQFYYYSFQWLHRGEQWSHPQATTYRGLEHTIMPKDLRNGEPATVGFLWLHVLRAWWQKGEMFDAGWHCSSCFATVSEMKKKMDSFSHTGWNTEVNRDTKTIVDRVRYGLDLFGRESEVYDRVEGNQDLPQYITTQGQRFGYLVDRDGENAGFSDVMASPPGGPAPAGGSKQ